MKTPLYSEHVALGAKMISFEGWNMPLLYRGVIQEHRHTREKASVFDTSHMGVFDLTGKDVVCDLDNLVTQSVSQLKAGACSYGYLLDETGGVLDDLICFRRGSSSFRLVVNAGCRMKDATWISGRLSSGVSFEDVTESVGKMDVQGPCSREELECSLNTKLPDLGFFRFQELMLDDIPLMISRTGYTGEFGYELFVPADRLQLLWKRMLKRDKIRPAGLGARDVLRLEMGYPLYGHELLSGRTPVAVSRGRFVNMSKSFIGKAAVTRDLENEPARVLVGLRLEGRQASRQHDAVMSSETVVGEVTSGLFSPSLNQAVAMAFVDKAFSRIGQELVVRVRRKLLRAEVVTLPFYSKGTARS